MSCIRITRPDDWHLHLRDGPVLRDVVAHVARRFSRAVVMPNLMPPVTTVDAALAYRERITAALPRGLGLEPLMTLYLTDDFSVREIEKAARSTIVHACKLYPAGATTHSRHGVSDPARIDGVLEAMQRLDLPLLVHGEVVDPEVDVFDREAVFIDRHLRGIVERFPALRVVLEHVTSREGVAFVRGAPATVAATITAHHLLLNRNALFCGGVRPHHYCLPVMKRETHRRALLDAATGGDPKFFLGSDSAPHERRAKESACGCAGLYTAHAAMELYAEAFERAGRLDRLSAFAGHHGPDFYRLPRNSTEIVLRREPWMVEPLLPFGDGHLVPFRAGEPVTWQLEETYDG